MLNQPKSRRDRCTVQFANRPVSAIVQRTLFVGIAILSGEIGLASDPVSPKTKELKSSISNDEQAIVDLTNRERQKFGLPPLTADPKLMQVARDHSENMARRNTLNHTLDGKSPFDRMRLAGYSFGYAGENIALGASTPEEVVQMWMRSPGHRANILNREFREIGVGAATAGPGRGFHTQVFATPLPNNPVGSPR